MKYFNDSTEDFTKSLKTTTDNLVIAAETLSEGHLSKEAPYLIMATSKLKRDAIARALNEENRKERITSAKQQLKLVLKKFENMDEAKLALECATERCEKKLNPLPSQQEEVATQEMTEEMKQEIKRLLGKLNYLLELIKTLTDMTDVLTRLNKEEVDVGEHCQARAPEEDRVNESSPLIRASSINVDEFELLELVTASEILRRTAQSIEHNPVSVTPSATEIKDAVSNDFTVKHLQDLSIRVANQQALVNAVTLAVSSLATAAENLMQNTERNLVTVSERTAKNALVTAKMNIIAAELTMATSSLTREASDFTSLRINLIQVKEKLTECKELNDTGEVYKSAVNLTAVALILTNTAKQLATPDAKEPIIEIARNLVTVATNLAITMSYVHHDGTVSLSDELDEVVEAVKKFTNAVSDLNAEESTKPTLPHIRWWQYCAYSSFFPFCCLLNHLNYIIIAFINDLYHATSVAAVYGVIIVFVYVLLDNIPYLLRCKAMKESMFKLQIVKMVTVALLLFYVGLDIALYFVLPIRNGFDDAANHFLSIYNTTAVFFTALVVYFFIKQRNSSPINVFSKALDSLFFKDEQPMHLGIKKSAWRHLTGNEKDVEVAKGLLKKIK
jgi:hypothetical protein